MTVNHSPESLLRDLQIPIHVSRTWDDLAIAPDSVLALASAMAEAAGTPIEDQIVKAEAHTVRLLIVPGSTHVENVGTVNQSVRLDGPVEGSLLDKNPGWLRLFERMTERLVAKGYNAVAEPEYDDTVEILPNERIQRVTK
jgi:hypothetical protein